MAAITLNATQSVSVGANVLSGFGPGATQNYGRVTLSLAQSPVTATIVSYAFTQPASYENEPVIFSLSSNALTALPVNISAATGVFNTVGFTLSANIQDGSLGAMAGGLVVTLSSFCLSASSLTGAPVSTAVDTTTLTVTLSTLALTAVNNPQAGLLVSADKHRRQRLAGYV